MPSADLRREGGAWLGHLIRLLDSHTTLAPHRQVLVLAGWLALLVGCFGGCGDYDDDDVRVVSVGSAPTSATHITVPPTEPDAFVEPGDWPKACELLTEADMEAVLPDITQLTQESSPISFTPGFNPEVHVRDARCTYRYHMAGTEDTDPVEAGAGWLELTVDLAGGERWVGDNFESMSSAMTQEDSLGAVACYSEPETYLCRTQNLAFTIMTASIPGVYRFEEDQGAEDLEPYFHDHVMPELVKTVNAKLAPS